MSAVVAEPQVFDVTDVDIEPARFPNALLEPFHLKLGADEVEIDIDEVPVAVAPALEQQTESELIAETLAWCARQFGLTSARLLRPHPHDGGNWSISTWIRDSVMTYSADPAEMSMAWMVGFTRRPQLATRPRVARADGSGMRPISAKSYLGIPLVCQDRLVGVIELAGNLPDDVDARLYAAEDRLALVAQRLVHDRSLRPAPDALQDVVCTLSGGSWSQPTIAFNDDEWDFLSVLTRPMTVTEVAAFAGLDLTTAHATATRLAMRGLIDLSNE